MEVWCWQQDCCIKSYLQDNHFIILWLKIFLYDMYMQQWLFNAITANKPLNKPNICLSAQVSVLSEKDVVVGDNRFLWSTTDPIKKGLG